MNAGRIDEWVLTHRGAGHRKEYRLWLEPEGNGWHVGYAYGRIGSRLREGRKTTRPLSRLEAIELRDRVYDEKLGKGYSDAFPMPEQPATAPVKAETRAPNAPPVRRVALVVNREGRTVIGF